MKVMLMPLAIAPIFFRIGMNISIPESPPFERRRGLTEKLRLHFATRLTLRHPLGCNPDG
jgi:hypothetical protein